MNDNTEKSNSLNNEIINLLVKDRKSDRRWRNLRFFTWIFLFLMFAILVYVPRDAGLSSYQAGKRNYVALIRLSGEIMPGTNFSADKVVPLLNKAFSDKNALGVVIVINSPGGSPVQASIIHDKILELKNKYHKKIIVVGEDMLASGAYLIATAADKIYVNQDTITGSVGVILSSFGLDQAIQKLGVQRRVFTAGTNKDRLDPFQPLNPQDSVKINQLLNEVHQDFINDVLQGRKGKLNGDQKELFSGDFWTGTTAYKLGLVDGTANLWTVLQDEFNVKFYKNYSARPSLWQAITKGADTELHLGLDSSASPIKAELNI